MSKQDHFVIAGGCWCPPERTIFQMRLMGHSRDCTEARQGWEANRRHLSQIEQRRREAEALGAEIRRSTEAVLAPKEDS